MEEELIIRPLLLELRCKCGGTFDIMQIVGEDQIFVAHSPPECTELTSMSTKKFLKWVTGHDGR